jgi:hypothetical protein
MKLLKNIRNSALAMSAVSVSMAPTAFAAVDDKQLINSILEVMYKMALYIGIILLAWGVIMLVLALKNEDADSKSRAIMLIAVSIALIGIKILVAPILDAVMTNGL